MKQKIWISMLLGLAMTLKMGCATTSVPRSNPRGQGESATSSRGESVRAENLPEALEANQSIDMVGLQRALGMERSSRQLGYAEKAFQTCQVGFGFPSSRDCQRRQFVVIHFQLMCRDSEGTLQNPLAESEMRAVSRESVDWTLAQDKGRLDLDEDGYGQIRLVTTSSPRSQRLKINLGSDFLYMRAGEIQRVVAPVSFCR